MIGHRLQRTDAWLMAGLSAVSLALSVPRLAERPLWLDEAFTVGATHELLPTLRHTGGTMALYYVLLTPLAHLSDSRFWLRLPSALLAAGTVAVVYAVGARLGGRRLAVVAGSLFAASWFLARYAMEARGYALALFLVSLSWLGLVAAVQEAQAGQEASSRRWWWVFVAGAVLAPLAHGLSVLQVPFQVVALLLAPGGVRFARRLVPVLGVLVVEFVGLFALGAGDVANWIPPLSWNEVSGFIRLLVGRGPSRWVVGAAFVGGLVLAGRGARVIGAVRRADRPATDQVQRAWSGLVGVLWALGLPLAILAISTVRPYASSRYVLSSLPGIALVAASAVVWLLEAGRPRALAGAAAWALLVVVLLIDQPKVTRNGLEDWPRLARKVTTEAHPGDLLLMPMHLRAPFDYAVGHGLHDPGLRPLSPTDPIGPARRLYTSEPGDLRARLLRAPSGTVWLVDRSRLDLPALQRLLADPAVRRAYRRTGSWIYAGQLYLIRLERRAVVPS